MGNTWGISMEAKYKEAHPYYPYPRTKFINTTAVKAKVSAANATIPLKVRARIDRNEGNMPNPEGGNENPNGPNVKMILNQTANPFAGKLKKDLPSSVEFANWWKCTTYEERGKEHTQRTQCVKARAEHLIPVPDRSPRNPIA